MSRLFVVLLKIVIHLEQVTNCIFGYFEKSELWIFAFPVPY